MTRYAGRFHMPSTPAIGILEQGQLPDTGNVHLVHDDLAPGLPDLRAVPSRSFPSALQDRPIRSSLAFTLPLLSFVITLVFSSDRAA
jgi:hypothetical protein